MWVCKVWTKDVVDGWKSENDRFATKELAETFGKVMVQQANEQIARNNGLCDYEERKYEVYED